MSDSAPPPPPPPSDPYGASPYGSVGGAQPGGVGARIGARVIDFIIVGIVSSIVVRILTGGSMMSADRSYIAVAVGGVIQAVIYLAYFTLLESGRGQTIGKMALKLKTEAPSGGNPTPVEALKRNLWTGVSVLYLLGSVGIYIGGLIALVVIIVLIVQVASNDSSRTTFMDSFAGGTRVVKIG